MCYFNHLRTTGVPLCNGWSWLTSVAGSWCLIIVHNGSQWFIEVHAGQERMMAHPGPWWWIPTTYFMVVDIDGWWANSWGTYGCLVVNNAGNKESPYPCWHWICAYAWWNWDKWGRWLFRIYQCGRLVMNHKEYMHRWPLWCGMLCAQQSETNLDGANTGSSGTP